MPPMPFRKIANFLYTFFRMIKKIHQIHIIPQQHFLRIYPSISRPIFEFEDAAGADGGTDAAADAAGAHDLLSFLSIGSYVYPHLAVGGAISAGDTLPAIGSDPEF